MSNGKLEILKMMTDTYAINSSNQLVIITTTRNTSYYFASSSVIPLRMCPERLEQVLINLTALFTSQRIACRWPERSREHSCQRLCSQPMDIFPFHGNCTSQSHGMAGNRKASDFLNRTVSLKECSHVTKLSQSPKFGPNTILVSENRI